MPKVNPEKLFIEGDGQNGADASRLGSNDSHLIVWDADTNTGYEFWEASRPSESSTANSAGIYGNTPIANQWNAANEVTWDMTKNTFRTLGYTSGDAAGLPIMTNVVRPDEVLTSAHGGQSSVPVIDHALRFTLPGGLLSHQFTYPASHAPAGSGTIPYGARFRLQNNPTVNALIAGMGPQAQAIAHAMQTYGLILADNGSAMYIQGAATSVDTNNNPIIDPTTGKAITWNMTDVLGLQNIPTTDFEAVDMTPKVASLSSSSGLAGNTITITGSNFSSAAGHLSVLFVPPGNTPPYTSNGTVTNLKAGVVVASTVTIVDDQHIQVVVPAGTGTVDIQVLSGQLLNDTYNSDAENKTAPMFGYGISAVTANDKFTYSTGTSAPTITTQPTNQAVNVGQLASFTAGASGSPTPTVQWQVSTNGGTTWNDVPGATATTYSFTTSIGQNGSEYRAVFTNSAGSATTLTVSSAPIAPVITTQPTPQTVRVGQTASFTAGASGSPAPTVQWQVSADGGSTWNDVAGATATTYSFTTSIGQNGSEYRAVFTNTAASATTNAATLALGETVFAVGGADGTVKLDAADGTASSTVTPIPGYTGLLSVALGDFDGDGIPELAVAAANPVGVAGLIANQAGKVFVFDGAAAAKGTLHLIHTFTPFLNTDGPGGTTGPFTNGLNIAAADINGDGKIDLIAGTRGQVGDAGGRPMGTAEFGRLAV